MKIAIGGDHRGYPVKEKLAATLSEAGHTILDCGTHNEESCDYPGIAYAVAKKVSENESDRGILVCMSGIGMAIVANKVQGVRAGLCHNLKSAQLSRQHNDANVLVLAAGEIGDGVDQIVKAWLDTDFEGGRHERRVNQIKEIEQKGGK